MFSKKFRPFIAASMALVLEHFFLESRASAAGPVEEKRIAIVIGNGAYPADTVTTAANDAGLIAQTLQAAGFDVVGARDLDSATMRATLREFIDKAAASGPETVAVVYFAGKGVQFEGENYLVPVDAQMTRDTDVPIEGMRVSDLTKSLGALPLKARIIVLDAARMNHFGQKDHPLAGGLALVQPDNGTLIAFNAAPGTIGPDEKGPYGSYASALSEMIKAGGLPLGEVFDRTRLRVADLTRGEQVPWQVSKVDKPFIFFERTADAPTDQTDRFAELKSKPLNDFNAADAYQAALARDTLAGYQEFLAAYPKDALAKRVRAIVAARREAATWRESSVIDSPEAYWTYLRRYPNGPHANEAHRRLSYYDAAFEPPSRFSELRYDIAPPFEDEMFYVERRPYIYFGDPIFEFGAPPILSLLFMSSRPSYFYDMRPPPQPIILFVLPTPDYYPVPRWVERPRYIAPPPPSVVSVDIHNTVIVNPVTSVPVVTSPSGAVVPLAAPAPAVVDQPSVGQAPAASGSATPQAPIAVAPALSVALPRAAARKLPPGSVPQTLAPAVTAPAGTAPEVTAPTAPMVTAPSAPAPKAPIAPVTPTITAPLAPTGKAPAGAAPAVLPTPDATAPDAAAPPAALPTPPSTLPTAAPASKSPPALSLPKPPALPVPDAASPPSVDPGVKTLKGGNQPQRLQQPKPGTPQLPKITPKAPAPVVPSVPTPAPQAPKLNVPAAPAPVQQIAPRAPPASSPAPTPAPAPAPVPIAPAQPVAPVITPPSPVQTPTPAPAPVPPKPVLPCGQPGEPACQ